MNATVAQLTARSLLGRRRTVLLALLPLALFGVLGLAAVVLVHEIAEVIVILNGLRAARTRK